MTNITLSIEDSVYKQMRQHSEIKWSELVRQSIKHFLTQLNHIEKRPRSDAFLTMLASEDVLRKDWETPEDEEAWKNL
mgnify:CR=1 FL=1